MLASVMLISTCPTFMLTVWQCMNDMNGRIGDVRWRKQNNDIWKNYKSLFLNSWKVHVQWWMRNKHKGLVMIPRLYLQSSTMRSSRSGQVHGSSLARLPQAVVDSIVNSLQYDQDVATQQRDFQVDGREGKGHLYQFRLRKTESNGTASVALMASATSFDMKKVVDHYETQEEPVFEFIPNPDATRRERTCSTRADDGRQCVFPFRYKGSTHSRCTTEFAGALWCATSTYQDGKMYNWGYCGHERCSEQEVESQPRFIKKFVTMAVKKFPVYSQRALPHGVSNSELTHAIDSVAAKEAVKIMA
ncbi:unnamed protein product [Polarella glacialis]|uniref:Fibronectin type-II domain-containing protein n=1 Tax=Polarella glacialis TaxID=89957 RepID=A0A813DAK5_POLGL|nr:unnamed protein product [Polarella glacialis]